MKAGVDYIGVSAGAMMINEAGEIFLAKRSNNAKNEKGCWETPGGEVDFGETLEEAVKREMKEEYGVEIVIMKQFPAENHLIPAENQHWVATTFLTKLKAGEMPRIKEPHKCEAIGWFALDKIPSPLSIITQLDIKHHQNEVRER